MAEAIGLIASVIQVAGAGLKLSQTLYQYADGVATADRRIKDIAKEIQLTSFVIEELGDVFKHDETSTLMSKNAVKTANETMKECSSVFAEIDATLKKSKKNTLGRLMLPFRDNKIELLRNHIDKLKSTLQLLMQVLTHAHQVATKKIDREAEAKQKAQIQELIELKKKSTKKYEETLRNISLSDGSTIIDPDEAAADKEDLDDEPVRDLTMAAAAIGSTITPKTLATCVQHVRNLLEDIETLQQALTTQVDGDDHSEHHQSLIGSYFRARGHLDNVLFSGSQAHNNGPAHSQEDLSGASAKSMKVQVDMQRVTTGSTLNEGLSTQTTLTDNNSVNVAQEVGEKTMNMEPEKAQEIESTKELRKPPIKFQDTLGRMYSLPFQNCKTWERMKKRIERIYNNEGSWRHLVIDGHFDILDSDGYTIMDEDWEDTIEPGMSLTMRFWTKSPRADIIKDAITQPTDTESRASREPLLNDSFECSPMFQNEPTMANNDWFSLFPEEEHTPVDTSFGSHTISLPLERTISSQSMDRSGSSSIGSPTVLNSSFRRKSSVTNSPATNGISKSRRRKGPLPAISVDPNDKVALKRARNTLAARESRQRKLDHVSELEKRNADLEAEIAKWKSIKMINKAEANSDGDSRNMEPKEEKMKQTRFELGRTSPRGKERPETRFPERKRERAETREQQRAEAREQSNRHKDAASEGSRLVGDEEDVRPQLHVQPVARSHEPNMDGSEPSTVKPGKGGLSRDVIVHGMSDELMPDVGYDDGEDEFDVFPDPSVIQGPFGGGSDNGTPRSEIDATSRTLEDKTMDHDLNRTSAVPVSQEQMLQGQTRTEALQAEIDATVAIMHENINKVSERGERLDSLQGKTEDLVASAASFRSAANKQQSNWYWHNPLAWLTSSSTPIVTSEEKERSTTPHEPPMVTHSGEDASMQVGKFDNSLSKQPSDSPLQDTVEPTEENTAVKPSQEYERFKQQTGLPSSSNSGLNHVHNSALAFSSSGIDEMDMMHDDKWALYPESLPQKSDIATRSSRDAISFGSEEKEKESPADREEARQRKEMDRGERAEEDGAKFRKRERLPPVISYSSSKRPRHSRRMSLTPDQEEEQRRLLLADMSHMQSESRAAGAREREENTALLVQQQQESGYYNPRAATLTDLDSKRREESTALGTPGHAPMRRSSLGLSRTSGEGESVQSGSESISNDVRQRKSIRQIPLRITGDKPLSKADIFEQRLADAGLSDSESDSSSDSTFIYEPNPPKAVKHPSIKYSREVGGHGEVEREPENRDPFAGLKKNTQFGPGSNKVGDISPSGFKDEGYMASHHDTGGSDSPRSLSPTIPISNLFSEKETRERGTVKTLRRKNIKALGVSRPELDIAPTANPRSVIRSPRDIMQARRERQEAEERRKAEDLRTRNAGTQSRPVDASETASSRANVGDKSSSSSASVQESKFQTNNEIRLRIDGTSPLSLQLSGDMEGRTLQLVPVEDGMTDLVNGGNTRSAETVYRSERSSVSGARTVNRRSIVTGQGKGDAEGYSERSSRRTRSRRERDEFREVRADVTHATDPTPMLEQLSGSNNARVDERARLVPFQPFKYNSTPSMPASTPTNTPREERARHSETRRRYTSAFKPRYLVERLPASSSAPSVEPLLPELPEFTGIPVSESESGPLHQEMKTGAGGGGSGASEDADGNQTIPAPILEGRSSERQHDDSGNTSTSEDVSANVDEVDALLKDWTTVF